MSNFASRFEGFPLTNFDVDQQGHIEYSKKWGFLTI